MKRRHDRLQGFLAGVLSAALALGLGSAALAAGRTIQIDDDISVTFNGAYFIPRDVNGAQVPLFAYNGTTYAPIRALCEAAGMRVDYDSATRTAQVTTADGTPAADPNAADRTSTDGLLSEARARDLALERAPEAQVVKCELEWDHGQLVYELELRNGRTEYECDIDAVTGAILKWEVDYD